MTRLGPNKVYYEVLQNGRTIYAREDVCFQRLTHISFPLNPESLILRIYFDYPQHHIVDGMSLERTQAYLKDMWTHLDISKKSYSFTADYCDINMIIPWQHTVFMAQTVRQAQEVSRRLWMYGWLMHKFGETLDWGILLWLSRVIEPVEKGFVKVRSGLNHEPISHGTTFSSLMGMKRRFADYVPPPLGNYYRPGQTRPAPKRPNLFYTKLSFSGIQDLMSPPPTKNNSSQIDYNKFINVPLLVRAFAKNPESVIKEIITNGSKDSCNWATLLSKPLS